MGPAAEDLLKKGYIHIGGGRYVKPDKGDEDFNKVKKKANLDNKSFNKHFKETK